MDRCNNKNKEQFMDVLFNGEGKIQSYLNGGDLVYGPNGDPVEASERSPAEIAPGYINMP